MGCTAHSEGGQSAKGPIVPRLDYWLSEEYFCGLYIVHLLI